MDTRDAAAGGIGTKASLLPDWTEPIVSAFERVLGSTDDVEESRPGSRRDAARASAGGAGSPGTDRVARTPQARKLRMWFGEKNRGRL